LVVCKRCGYGYYGKIHSRKSAGTEVRYGYYRCTGSDAHRFGGQRLCPNKQVRTDLLDAAVWEDVRCLLSEPGRIKDEYQRRCSKTNPDGARAVDQVAKLINQVKKSISRIIDAYEQGLVEKSEFEPRIVAARERLSRLEEERKREADQEVQESELRVVIGQLEEFARRVSEELREPGWLTRREIIRALVKQVEIDEDEVRVVYRVSPSPFEGGPQQPSWQHCWGLQSTAIRRSYPASGTLGREAGALAKTPLRTSGRR
jgi:site-specific DNA recombinase